MQETWYQFLSLLLTMLNTQTNRYFTPEELEGEDDIPVDEETLEGTIDIFA